MQSNKHHLLFLLLLLFSTLSVLAQEDLIKPLPIKPLQDTIVAPKLPLTMVGDTTLVDSTQVDSLNGKDPLLLDKIKYKAKDYVKLSQKDKKIYLYNEAEIYYQDTELKAGIIIMDYIKNEVYAGRIKDSLGNYTQIPYFKQGGNVVIPDSIRFNFDTQKALIWNSRTEQQAGLGQLGSDAMKVYAEITKKENDSVYFLNEGKLTTSKDTIDPDYYIRVKKAKFVPKKKVIAGFSNLYIVDVPTPLALPFAYFPLTTGRTAGLIFPTFGNDPNRGYFLQNGGYYFPFSDYADLAVFGDFYTNGSYGFRAENEYSKRYRFRGRISFNFENIINSQKGFDDFSRSTSYQVRINHTQDPKSNPNSRLSANVNLGSNNVFTNSLLQQNVRNTVTNQLNSSISYSKTFPEYPSVNLSLTASHSQSTNEDVDRVSLTLPTLQASMERIFPFAKRDGIKKGVVQNINFQYDVNAQNSIQTNGEEFFTARMFDDARIGARHRIPINTNFKVAKHFSVSLGGSYEDVWALETIDRNFDAVSETVVTDTISGFDRFNQYNFSVGVGTTLYGTFNFGEDKKIQAIRHVMRPNISYGYAPSFDQFYDEYINTVTNDTIQFTRFEGGLFGTPRLGQSNALSFSLANTLEAKVRDRDSTATEPKKVFILNSFNLSSGYNFEADSLRISPVNITGGTTILNNKMQINFGASLDPYAINNNGTRINTFNIDNGGSLFRLTSARANIGYSLSSEIFNKKRRKEEDDEEEGQESYDGFDALFGEQDEFGRQRQDRRDDDRDTDDIENPVYGTKIPWDLNLRYTINYSNSNRQNQITANTLSFGGNIELSPRWKVGVTSGYDFVDSGFVITNLRFERDLKSFRLNFDWTPFGRNERWFFFIGIKSSILSDLKWENRSQPPRQ
ncbi:MAG: putative LPS assembly protein LptD [Saonia sp.]